MPDPTPVTLPTTYANPISNYKAKLMIKPGSASEYSMICPIKGTPKLGGEPNVLDSSTNEDSMQKNIFGMQKAESTSVKANWDPAVYKYLKSIEKTTQKLALWLGNAGTGDSAKIEFDGQIAVAIPETDVDAVLEIEIFITVTGDLAITTPEG